MKGFLTHVNIRQVSTSSKIFTFNQGLTQKSRTKIQLEPVSKTGDFFSTAEGLDIGAKSWRLQRETRRNRSDARTHARTHTHMGVARQVGSR